jgi:hypothetical protein
MNVHNLLLFISALGFLIIGVSAAREFKKWRTRYFLAVSISSIILVVITILKFLFPEIVYGTGGTVYYIISTIAIIVVFVGLGYHMKDYLNKRKTKN